MNGYIKSPIPIKSSCWVPQYRWQAPPSPNDRQNSILIVTWSLFWEPVYNSHRAQSSLAFLNSVRKRDTHLKAQAVRSSWFSNTGPENHKDLFSVVSRGPAGLQGCPSCPLERRKPRGVDWSAKFLPVLKSIILLCDSFKIYQGARNSWQVKPISSCESP